MAYLIIGIVICIFICLITLYVSNNWNRWKFFKDKKRRAKQ